ncbi:MAG: molybdenum cofactor sulfurase, partial [Mesorhizobium sp.]
MQETNLELFPMAEPMVDIVPGRKLAAKAAALYAAPHDHFETRAVEELR